MGIVGFFLGILMNWGTMNSIFLGVMLAMSSTMSTMKSIEDLGMKDRKFSDLAMGTLVIEDIIAIFAMVILSTIAVSQSISGVALAALAAMDRGENADGAALQPNYLRLSQAERERMEKLQAK
jgi:Kef-type K+ transport system membrane component KefB